MLTLERHSTFTLHGLDCSPVRAPPIGVRPIYVARSSEERRREIELREVLHELLRRRANLLREPLLLLAVEAREAAQELAERVLAGGQAHAHVAGLHQRLRRLAQGVAPTSLKRL